MGLSDAGTIMAISEQTNLLALNAAIDKLEKILNMIDKDKDDAIIAIQNISSIAEETAASTEELSASMEEQTVTMESIFNNTKNLADTIEKLHELVNKFKI